MDSEWVTISGGGKVYSFSIVHRAPSREFASITPYVLALIELDEGPRMLAHIVGETAMQAAINDQVEVVFEMRQGGARIPQFVRRAA
jgi:hypothetical protein